MEPASRLISDLNILILETNEKDQKGSKLGKGNKFSNFDTLPKATTVFENILNIGKEISNLEMQIRAATALLNSYAITPPTGDEQLDNDELSVIMMNTLGIEGASCGNKAAIEHRVREIEGIQTAMEATRLKLVELEEKKIAQEKADKAGSPPAVEIVKINDLIKGINKTNLGKATRTTPTHRGKVKVQTRGGSERWLREYEELPQNATSKDVATMLKKLKDEITEKREAEKTATGKNKESIQHDIKDIHKIRKIMRAQQPLLEEKERKAEKASRKEPEQGVRLSPYTRLQDDDS